MLVSAEEQNYKSLVDYYNLLELTAQRALKNSKSVLRFQLSGKNVSVVGAGDELLSSFKPAFAHLPGIDESGNSDLEIIVWDEKLSKINLPEPPWEWPTLDNLNSVSWLELNGIYAFLYEKKTIFTIYNSTKNKTIVVVKDYKDLPNNFLSSPFLRVIHLWAKQQNLLLLHSGCVDYKGKSALFVGKSGSGKSTSSLVCLLNGLNYLSDDYTLVDTQNGMRAYSIFNSGKLHSNHLKNFEELEDISTPQDDDVFDKPLIFMSQLFKKQLLSSSNLKVIIAPTVTQQQHTSIVPISPFEALKALAPSTLIQMNGYTAADFAQMANITQLLSCYQLRLGADFKTVVAPIIKQLLE